MRSRKALQQRIEDIEDEYKPSNDIFCEDDSYIISLKKVLWNTLDDTERRIILVYSELGNLRDTARVFKVSTSTIWKEVKKIRDKIKCALTC